MKRSKGKNKTKVVNWILNVVIVVLSFFFVMTAGVMIGEIYHAVTPGYSADSFYYSIKEERYYSMVGAYHRNMQGDYEADKEIQEYYGVAKYFEAASLYHAYQVAGNEEMADFFAQKMELAEEEMGGWSAAGKPIRKYLGIEE